MVEANTEALNNNTDSIRNETLARNALNGALSGLGNVIGGLIQGAPQGFSDALRIVPRFGNELSSVMAAAEGYVGVWRDLTTRGIHFGNELDTMITSVGRANLKLDQFQRIAAEQSQTLAALGGVTNAGVTDFIALQQNFMAKTNGAFDPLRVQLENLGMNAEQIAERFLEFDAIANITGFRGRMREGERNRLAAEYAMRLDELSRLTGKQIDQISDEMKEAATQGNIYAYASTLTEEAGLAFQQTMGDVAASTSEPITRYITDMMTRGFIDANDPAQRMIKQAAGNLDGYLRQAQDAYERGDATRGDYLMRVAQEEARRIRENPTIRQLGMLGNATEETAAAMEIMSGQNREAAVLSTQAVEAQARSMFNLGENTRASAEQMAQARLALLEADRESQRPPEPGDTVSPGRQLLNDYLGALRETQDLAMEGQDIAVAGVFETAQGAVNSFRDELSQIDMAAIFRDAAAEVIGFGSAILNPGGQGSGPLIRAEASQMLVDQLNTLATRLADQDRDDEALQIGEAAAALGTAIQDYQAQPTADTLRELNLARAAAEQIIEANREVFVTGETINIGGTPIERLGDVLEAVGRAAGLEFDVGTMGRLGTLFSDFGNGTRAVLHGMEAVVTPEQMAGIVQNSALGAMRASASVFQESNARSSSTMLNGMLNTIRTLPGEISQSQGSQQSVDIENVMSRIATQMKQPLEEAMNSTLVPRLEQLVDVNTNHLNTSQDIKRNTGNMGTDLLRRS